MRWLHEVAVDMWYTQQNIASATQRCIFFFFFFFEKKIYFHKTNLQKNHTYYKQKKQKIKTKKKLETLKEGKERSGGSHYVIHSTEIHNLFKLFSLYTFYVID